MSVKNRAKLARERAGLTIGQAARLLNMSSGDLLGIEERDGDFAVIDPMKLAEVYQVRVLWLTGVTPLRDYESMKGTPGWDEMSRHDQDMVAEFAASLPRNDMTAAERLEKVRKKS